MSQEAWAKAWVAAWAELPDVRQGKTVDTGKFSYTYAPLDFILGLVRGTLAKHGFAVTQSAIQADGGVAVETRIIHKEGHTESYGPTFIAVSGTAQAVGSAITYARRYGLVAALGIATEEDDDGGKASEAHREATTIEPRKRIPKDDVWDRVCETVDTKDRTAVFTDALTEAGVPLDKANTTTTDQAIKAIEYIDSLETT